MFFSVFQTILVREKMNKPLKEPRHPLDSYWQSCFHSVTDSYWSSMRKFLLIPTQRKQKQESLNDLWTSVVFHRKSKSYSTFDKSLIKLLYVSSAQKTQGLNINKIRQNKISWRKFQCLRQEKVQLVSFS